MKKKIAPKIIKVSGPLVVAEGMMKAKMYDMVRVGEMGLIGEIIEIKEDKASIQVYEETSGLGPGDPATTTMQPLSVELGPGLMNGIYDGIQRPLDIIRDKAGSHITRGITLPAVNRRTKWDFVPAVKKGERVEPGDILGTVQETPLVVHKVLVPSGITGQISLIKKGKFTVTQTIAKVKTASGAEEIRMLQRWPIRRQRKVQKKLPPEAPLVAGQRVIDTFFPVAKGGTACVPGPFGSGKTVVLHCIAAWADAHIIVYIGCGERGNEMTDVLLEFPRLKDPKTGRPLIERTIMIANTSDMPVAAREASIYTGITIAEYYRDMGYNVAVMADSTSRWAEALREISGRLEEMPGEEGYPAYLGTRVAEFYERAGRVICQGRDKRPGTLTVMGAVSPPGGDLSDPVVQATLRTVKVFWALEDRLAYMRHFPAINWLNSYSLYLDNIEEYLGKEIAGDWMQLRNSAMAILQEEDSLQEIVRLVGKEALAPREQLVLETAKSIREDYLMQDAFHEVDVYSPLDKQYRMLRALVEFHRHSQNAMEKGISLEQLIALKVKEKLVRMKYIEKKNMKEFDEIERELKREVESLIEGKE
jgi:V/A-type H+-transporting ATPase subunit A